MKNIDSILKKAELFEKLAVYSDRRTFLRSLSQAAPINANVENKIDNLVKDLAATAPGSERLQHKLMDFIPPMGNNTDLHQLYKVVQEAAYAIPESNMTQRDNALELAKIVSQLENPQPEESFTQSVNVKPTTVTGVPPISKNIQSMLNDLLVPSGKIFPLKLDGQLGSETRKALQAFRETFKVAPTEQSIAQMHQENNTSKSKSNAYNPNATSNSDAGVERDVKGPTA